MYLLARTLTRGGGGRSFWAEAGECRVLPPARVRKRERSAAGAVLASKLPLAGPSPFKLT